MVEFERQKGVAFFLLFFSNENRYYYLRLSDLLVFWERMQEGGRKSFRQDELNPAYYLPERSGFLVPYLDGIKMDLEDRD